MGVPLLRTLRRLVTNLDNASPRPCQPLLLVPPLLERAVTFIRGNEQRIRPTRYPELHRDRLVLWALRLVRSLRPVCQLVCKRQCAAYHGQHTACERLGWQEQEAKHSQTWRGPHIVCYRRSESDGWLEEA